jgi:hypothetical protein
MNLRRGLLRLWIVLSLLWVTAMTWLLWSELTITYPNYIFSTPHNGRYELEGPEGATREQALEKFYSRLETEKNIKPEDRAALLAARPNPAPPPGFVLDQRGAGPADEQVTVTNERAADWPRRRNAAAAIFLPPLAVIIIGVGLFWAGQGFLKRQAEPPR